jgi:hypothetical protein
MPKGVHKCFVARELYQLLPGISKNHIGDAASTA